MPTTGIDNLATPYATPTLRRLGSNADFALIECRGDYSRRSWRKLARIADAVACDTSVHVALLVIDSQAASWPCCEAVRCAQAIWRLHAAKPTIAFIENCVGAAYMAAAAAGTIVARPAAKLGLFAACDLTAEWAWQSHVMDYRPQAGDSLEELSPRIVSGEAAESLRLVDHLTDSPERWLADFFVPQPDGPPVQPFRVLSPNLVAIVIPNRKGESC
jgi:hypothetical protein